MLSALKRKDLLTIADFSQDEIYYVLSKAMELKRLQKLSEPHKYLEGKTVGLIFQKPSTRTRVSFEVAIAHLGGHPLYLNADDLQLGRGESVEDTGRVLSRYVDAIVIRTFAQTEVENLARAADVPVINGLTDEHHPCQILADLMTILETKDRLSGLKLAYLGDGNNIANSLLLGTVKVGMSISIASPKGYEPKQPIVQMATNFIKNPKMCKLEISNDPAQALASADVVYTDVWTSMGQEEEREQKLPVFKPFQVNAKILSYAKPDAILMHCLPAHRGEEITDEVLDGPQSVVFNQAENRLHVQKSLLALLIG
jgi:ornithine carbamoyltransferase